MLQSASKQYLVDLAKAESRYFLAAKSVTFPKLSVTNLSYTSLRDQSLDPFSDFIYNSRIT